MIHALAFQRLAQLQLTTSDQAAVSTDNGKVSTSQSKTPAQQADEKAGTVAEGPPKEGQGQPESTEDSKPTGGCSYCMCVYWGWGGCSGVVELYMLLVYM